MKVGSNVTFYCNISSLGVPSGTISWFHNGNYIENEKETDLTVHVVDDSLFGNYSCIVSNIIGIDEAALQLEQECKSLSLLLYLTIGYLFT